MYSSRWKIVFTCEFAGVLIDVSHPHQLLLAPLRFSTYQKWTSSHGTLRRSTLVNITSSIFRVNLLQPSRSSIASDRCLVCISTFTSPGSRLQLLLPSHLKTSMLGRTREPPVFQIVLGPDDPQYELIYGKTAGGWTLTFGKHRGERLHEVPYRYLNYIQKVTYNMVCIFPTLAFCTVSDFSMFS